MEKRQRVLIYGDTLVLTGVRLCLEANPAFEIIPLDTSYISGQDGLTGQELLTMQPDVVIFDTSSVQPQFHCSLIQEQSGLQLIAVNPDRDQILVWSGRHLRELTLQDLVNIIHQQDPNSEL